MRNKKLTVLLDAGHGGVIDGVYQTKGKRSPIWSDGTQLFEGVLARSVVNGIAERLIKMGIDVQIISDKQADTKLSTRVQRANAYADDHPNTDCVGMSVHFNAGGGTGYEVFTYHGQSQSDALADVWLGAMANEFPNARNRGPKEADFYIVRKTSMPFILTESFFMDTETDCKLLMSPVGHMGIVTAHVNTIIKYMELNNYEPSRSHF